MEQQPFQEQTAKKQPEVQQRTRAVKEKIMVEREENGKINVTIQT